MLYQPPRPGASIRYERPERDNRYIPALHTTNMGREFEHLR